MIYGENVNVRRNWETCRRGAAESRWAAAYVSLNQYGDIILNKIAHESLGSPETCALLYDRERLTIGIKPSPIDMNNAFPLRPRGPHGGVRIRAHRLLRDFGIAVSQTLVFDGCQIDNRGILILDTRMARELTRKKKKSTYYTD